MEPPTPTKTDNLEVTGVSRSGRVRKKSSKLTDFQSPDDIDASRAKRLVSGKSIIPKVTSSQPPPLVPTSGFSPSTPSLANVPLQPLQSPPRIKMEQGIEIVSPTAIKINAEAVENASTGDLTLNDADITSDDGENALLIDTTVRKSAYMTEKSNKKKIFKDGKLVPNQRKDKGKSRFTAYMLWAKDVRQEMLYTYPDMDFSTISRRLGEMWANVPSNEKYNWRRRAKRLAAKGTNKDKNSTASSKAHTAPATKFLNRNTPSRGKKSAGQNDRNTGESTGVGQKTDSQKNQQIVSPVKSSSTSSTTPTKTSGTSAMDVAAHLKLLGDSLTIIGQRLKEHEGQIAVSGSLSVLLDSLLCSVAPLMCLTTYIPEMGVSTGHLKETMSDTLDNIAYVMPGL